MVSGSQARGKGKGEEKKKKETGGFMRGDVNVIELRDG